MSSDIIFAVNKNGRIRIAHEALTKIVKFKQHNISDSESGGVLMGTFLDNGGLFFVKDFTAPQNSDEQGRRRFFRSNVHNRLVNERWKESDGFITYVGLWHTHPESIPQFSSVDKNDWIDALRNSSYDGNNLLFMIVGETHVSCWLGTKSIFRCKFTKIGELSINEIS